MSRSYIVFCYASMFIAQVVLASEGKLVQEQHGAAMLLFLIFAPFTVPAVILLAICFAVVRLVFILGSFF